MENSMQKRLSLQNEILKCLNEFSEKLQQRANATTLEVHELLDQTEIVEQDMKNTLNSFRNLSYLQFIENKVSDEDEISGNMKEDTKKSAEVSIPAQSYEADILPRYKEALSLGLRSYRNHMQRTNRTSSSGSVFKTGLSCGPLPHIIGSEEYIHDNSCGLPVDSLLERVSLDFSHVAELKRLKGVLSYAGNFGSDTIFSEDSFQEQEEPSEKEGIEPLVSAASDFKAMLEAALLSPYKFYDEESSSLSDIVHSSEQDNVTRTISDTQHLTNVMDTIVPVTPGHLTSFQNSDFETQNSCSALISGSLFDIEEDSTQSIDENPEVFSTKEDNLSKHACGETCVEDDDDGSVSHDPEDGTSTCVCSVTVPDGDGLEGHSQFLNDPPRGCLHKDSFDTQVSSDQTVEGFLSLPVNNKFDDSSGDDDDKNDLSH